MKIVLSKIIALAMCVLLTSCLDFSQLHQIDGPYFVKTDPGANYQTLYYDLGDGNAIGRVENVKRVGHTDEVIIPQTQEGYYFIDRRKDHEFLNGSEIIGSPKTRDYFINWLNSSKIGNFKFEYNSEK